MSSVAYRESTSGEHVERRDVVEDEEEIVREEDQVMEEIDREVSHAEIEDGGFNGGVGRSEGVWRCFGGARGC